MNLVCAVFGHAKTVKLFTSDGCPRCLKIIGEDGNYYDLFSPWSIHSPKAFARHQARMEEYWKPTAVTACTDLTQKTVKITCGKALGKNHIWRINENNKAAFKSLLRLRP